MYILMYIRYFHEMKTVISRRNENDFLRNEIFDSVFIP